MCLHTAAPKICLAASKLVMGGRYHRVVSPPVLLEQLHTRLIDHLELPNALSIANSVLTMPTHNLRSHIPYHPEGRGIQAVQKYVTTIPEDHYCTSPSGYGAGVYKYDFVGAVGLKKGKA
jgi:hypothetical protein